MTQSDFKNQVDNLMNILWGAGVASHATIIEQINYLVFLRSLSRKDDNAMKLDPSAEMLFSGELKKYNWNNLLILNAEELFNTLEEVFRRLPEVTKDQTIKLLFRDAHVKIFDKPTLRRLVHEIEKMFDDLEKLSTSGHTDIFGDMYEYLLSKLSQAGTLGSFRTPRHIIKFIVDIIDPKKGETILDPACGTAGFLVAALKHLEEKYTSEDYKKIDKYPMDLLSSPEREFVYKHTFTGFDSDFDMFKFGLMNLYLHKLEHPNIKRQNTLVDTAGDRTKWDVILANPPFAGALDIDSVSEDLRMGTRSTEILFLRYMIDHLSASGRAGVIVPEGVVFNSTNAHKKIRQMLVEDAGLWCVVSLPGGIFNPYAGVKTSILFFDKSLKNKVDNILFVKIENDGFDLGAQRRPIEGSQLKQIIKIIEKVKKTSTITQDELEKYSGDITALNELKNKDLNNYETEAYEELCPILVNKSRLSENGYNLNGEQYGYEITKENTKWPMVKLGEICETSSGGTPLKSKIEYYKNGTIPWLRSGEVAQGFINKSELFISEQGLKNSSAKIFPINTVLVAMYGATAGQVGILKFCSSTNQAVCGVFPNEKIIPEYLYLVLKSLKEKMISLSGGGAQPNISQGIIKNLEIPLPPLEIQKQIVEEIDGYQKIIDGAKQVVENWKPSFKIDLEKLTKIGEIGDIEYGYTDTAKPKGDCRFIRITDIDENGELKSEDKKYINLTKESEKFILSKGDILVARTGATYGKTMFFNGEEKSVFASFLIRLRFNPSIITPMFYWIFSQSKFYWDQAKSLVTGCGQPQFNGNAIKNIKVPIISLEEQEKIINQIKKEKVIIDSLKELINLYQKKINQKVEEVWSD